MLDPRQPRLPARTPTVSPPPPIAERRAAYRRAEDRQAHEERALLARALDVLAADTTAEARLAGLLRLLARTAGAERAAVLADGIDRRSAVSIQPGEDPAPAEALAVWLDATAGRSRAERAASGRAPVSIVVGADDDEADSFESAGFGRDTAPATRALTGSENSALAPDPDPTDSEGHGPWYALLPIPATGDVVLGFEFRGRAAADRLAERLPPQLARHAAVALALVTEQLAMERDIASLRAREAERTQFVSTVAHELRTPLTGLRGYLELILGGRVDDPEIQRDFLERSHGIVGSMAELVGDLLEVSKLESGALSLESEPFSVADAVGRVAADLMPIALDREIRLRTNLPPRMRTAMGDRRRVEQILTNLAANGLKFTPAGGIVEIDGRFDGSVSVLVVRDDGPGISIEDRPLIFERFHRLSSHERITGTGLGLPIARELARLMAGDLDVASVPGAGSAFVIVLPGPADASSEAVAAALGRALGEEEVGLEERAVLRAMALAGRGGPGRQSVDGTTANGSSAPRRQPSLDRPDGRQQAPSSRTSRHADG